MTDLNVFRRATWRILVFLDASLDTAQSIGCVFAGNTGVLHRRSNCSNLQTHHTSLTSGFLLRIPCFRRFIEASISGIHLQSSPKAAALKINRASPQQKCMVSTSQQFCGRRRLDVSLYGVKHVSQYGATALSLKCVLTAHGHEL